MYSKYINPFTDFGFKKLFGEEASKPQLIDFLNCLLPENDKIFDLSFKDKDQSGKANNHRKAVYDIYCENEKGEKFIVELQSVHQQFFKDRTIYYSTFPIQEQAKKGDWNYELKSVYCVGVLGFTFDDYKNEPEKGEVIHTVQLKDQNNKIFYNKLKYVYVEVPNFKKKLDELETQLDKWLYFIKNLENLNQIPEIFKDTVFIEAFQNAELAKFTEAERASYEASLKTLRDNYASFESAKKLAFLEGEAIGEARGIKKGEVIGEEIGIKKGEVIGRDEERKESELRIKKLAKTMKNRGEPIEKIIEYTGLTKEEIDAL